MPYKTIVVHLDSSARRSERLELACRLARTQEAHLVGFFALAGLTVPFALSGNVGLVIAAEQRWRDDAAAAAERDFRAATRRHGLDGAEWRSASRDALDAALLNVRYADLLVIGQPDPDDPQGGRMPPHFADDLVLTAGRPVLLVPYAGSFETLGTRVLVAWNAGREAARAVADALPLLQRASAVHVVAFDPDDGDADHGEEPGADIALYLARHGVRVTAAKQHAGIDVGAQILSRAADESSDLIVMGGYGHSRARELVLGGATRTVLGSMTVPVLMSH